MGPGEGRIARDLNFSDVRVDGDWGQVLTRIHVVDKWYLVCSKLIYPIS